MQNNTNEPFDLDKRKIHSEQYDVPPPDGGTWTQLEAKIRAKIQSEQITRGRKSEKTKTTVVKL